MFIFRNAGGRTRTGTVFTPRDFKSLVSANSTTPAKNTVKSMFSPTFEGFFPFYSEGLTTLRKVVYHTFFTLCTPK